MSEGYGKPVIMAVDDSKVQLMAYEQLFLSIRGLKDFHLQSFQKPREAMDRLIFMLSVGYKPCLILLDLNMEGFSGLEFLSAMRAQPSLISIPVLIASSSSNPEDVRKALGHGAQDYLVKPIRTTHFSAKVLKWAAQAQGDADPAVQPA